MAVAMARPWKHPKTGVYWLRRGVPEDLRVLVGKREEKRTLGTKDPIEAKRRHAIALADLETRWASLRKGFRVLSEREAHELGAPVYERWLSVYRENPSEQTSWRTDLADRMWAPPKPVDLSKESRWMSSLDLDESHRHEQEARSKAAAADILSEQGLVVDDAGKLRLAKAVAAAVQRASLVLAQLEKGENVAPPINTFPARRSSNAAVERDNRQLPFEDLVKGWAAERRPAAKTLYEWPRILRHFRKHLGHDDAKRVTFEDFVTWKAAMVEAGLRAKTIRDAKIAPVRAILQWAVDNRLLPSNPAEKINIQVKTKAAEGRRGFTDEEARIILRAAEQETNPVLRWVPLLCAYSGARVAEVCQLRAEDVITIDEIAAIRFTADAGSLKTASSERVVPLHTAVIESGFLAFAAKVEAGPLFAELRPDKFGSRGGTGTKVIGPWVRGLGLTDERLAPNHSWRHRLKTLGRRHGLAGDIVDAIVGHARRTVGDSYGEFPIAALERELSKLPLLSTN